MPAYKNIFLVVAFLTVFCARTFGQFYNLPNDYSFSLLTEKVLAAKDSSLHNGIKPYIHFFSDKYKHVEDSHRIFKFIKDDPALDVVFFKHIIRVESKNEKLKLILDPVLNLELGRDYANNSSLNLYTNTRGFIGCGYIGDKVYFETILVENQSVFPVYVSKQVEASLVAPGQGRWKNFKVGGYDYAFSTGFVSVQAFRNLNIQVGHGKQKVGHGYRSLLLSDNSFNYPYARITQQWFKGRLQYNNIYAVLMNLVPASVKPNPFTERLFQKKAASFQYLSFNFLKSLNVGLFQGLVWQAGDGRNAQKMDWQYFNPVIYSNLVTYGLNNRNNVLIGGDIKIKLSNKINVYGQIMYDNIGYKQGGLCMGFQTGIHYFDALGIKNLFFQAEYNDVGAGSYLNPAFSATDQSFSHYNQNLSYTPGAGRELVFIADYKKKRFFTNIKYNYQDIPLMSDRYFFNNIINFRFGYVINPAYNLNISLGLNYRNQNFYNFKTSNNETNYIFLALKTSLYNLYYDF